MSVQAQYQYEFEEYRDGLKQLNRLALGGKNGKYGRGIVGWILFIGLAIMFFTLMRRNPSAAPSSPTPPAPPQDLVMNLLVPLIPWLLIFGFIWFFVFRQLRGNPRKQFDQRPALHRPQTVTFDEDGVSFVTTTESTRILWPAFVRFEETPTFLFLFTAPGIAHMIPKRAFHPAASMQEAIHLARMHVGGQISAFPVIPMAKKEEL